MTEFSGVPAKLYKDYRVKRQETDDMFVDFAERLAVQYVDDVRGKIVSEMENLNNKNQRLVDLNEELIEHVRVVEEEKRVLLEQKGEFLETLKKADKQQKQSGKDYSEVEKTLNKALKTVDVLEEELKAQGESLKEQEVKLSTCERGEDKLWQTAVEVAERLTALGAMWGRPMRDTDGLQRNFGIHGVFSQIFDSLSQLKALGDVVKNSEKETNHAWETVKEVGERVKAKQVELDTTKVNFTKVESQLVRQEAEAREEVEQLRSVLAKNKGEMANFTNTLKSAEKERDSLKRELETVEVEKKNAKESLEELKKKVEETALEEEERVKGALDLKNKSDCCAPLLIALAKRKAEVAGLNRRLGMEGAQQKPSNVRRAMRRQVQQEEKRSRRAGEDTFGRVGGVKRRGDRSEDSSSESSRRRISPEDYISYSERHRDSSSERRHRPSDRSGGEGRGNYSSRRG